MEQRIIDAARKYKETADMLEYFEMDKSYDDALPQMVQAALLKLYYAVALDEKLSQCEDLMTEETDEETVDAIAEAGNAIEKAKNEAVEAVEEYTEEEKDFARALEDVSLGSKAGSLTDLLLKLYKCEGIIRMAYWNTKQFPIYGVSKNIAFYQTDEEPVTDPEAYILQKTGIDIYALLEARARLVGDIGEKMDQSGF